jgi:glycosyltransferase involved in cell wall biosynthesis
MTERPLVSVILPVYNGAAFLRDAIESVLAQDYRPFELIVVDDGSSDGSGAIARSYPGVTCIRQENLGASAARNTGIAASRGTILAFVDADDTIPSNKLTLQVTHLIEHPDVACVLGRQQWVDPPAGLVRDSVFGDLDGIPIGSMVVRRAAFDAVGEHDEEMGGDLDFLVRLREHGYGIAVLSELVLIRRYHGSNLVAGKGLPPLPAASLKAKLDRERARA